MKAICHNCKEIVECHIDIRNIPLESDNTILVNDIEAIVCDNCDTVVGITNNEDNTKNIRKVMGIISP